MTHINQSKIKHFTTKKNIGKTRKHIMMKEIVTNISFAKKRRKKDGGNVTLHDDTFSFF